MERFYVLTGLFFTLLKDLAHMLIYERGALFQIHGISQNIDLSGLVGRSFIRTVAPNPLRYPSVLFTWTRSFWRDINLVIFSRLMNPIRKTKSLT